VTLSAGIAELQPDDDAMSVFERADSALYRAKAQGKGTAA
jgi:PleD family two-component response regulator